MTNSNLQNLPPEMQERIQNIIQQAGMNAPTTSTNLPIDSNVPRPLAPSQRPPSLMDHTIALRQEVAQMSLQVEAMGQVVEAVGNAVGQLYAMFQQQTEVTDYSSNYQTQEPSLTDDY